MNKLLSGVAKTVLLFRQVRGALDKVYRFYGGLRLKYMTLKQAAWRIAQHVEETTNRLDIDPAGRLRFIEKFQLSEQDILAIYQNRIAEIQQYTHESVSTIVNKMISYQGAAEALWHELPSNGLEFTFHATTPRLIYAWVGIVDYLALMRELVVERIQAENKKDPTVLDFAAGNGHVALRLAEAGFQVTYADIGLEVMKFVKWRCQQRNLNVTFAPVADGEVKISSRYDYIICFNALSHFKDVREYLRRFYRWLKDDGKLFVADDVTGRKDYDAAPPWHLRENERYTNPELAQELFEDFELVATIWDRCKLWRKKGK